MAANMMAGPVAGVITCFMFYPFDTLKTRLQSPEYRRAAAKHASQRLWFRGLYQGISPIILVTMPSSAAFFGAYISTKRLLTSTFPSLPSPLITCAGCTTAELIGSAVATPAEVIKQNAQVLSRSSGSSSLAALKVIGRDPRNLWRGYTLLAGRNLPFVAVQFPLYEELRVALTVGRDSADVWEMGKATGVAAGVAGGLAAWVTTPVDVVKTRVMLMAGKGRVKVGEVAGRVYGEGVRELFRGGAVRMVLTALGSGVYLSIYEGLVVWLEG